MVLRWDCSVSPNRRKQVRKCWRWVVNGFVIFLMLCMFLRHVGSAHFSFCVLISNMLQWFPCPFWGVGFILQICFFIVVLLLYVSCGMCRDPICNNFFATTWDCCMCRKISCVVLLKILRMIYFLWGVSEMLQCSTRKKCCMWKSLMLQLVEQQYL